MHYKFLHLHPPPDSFLTINILKPKKVSSIKTTFSALKKPTAQVCEDLRSPVGKTCFRVVSEPEGDSGKKSQSWLERK